MSEAEDEEGLPHVPNQVLPFCPGISYTCRKKRSRAYDESNSSETPLFSSDDLNEADASKYVSPRKKTQYRHTWWEDEGSSDSSKPAKIQKRDTRRKPPPDSGVFMGSDESSSTTDDGFGVEQLNSINLKRHEKTTGFPFHESPKITPEARARSRVNECLEEDNTNIDLSNFQLTHISNDIIRPLQQIIRRPRVHDTERTSDEYYHSFTPQLKLILSTNLLRQVPTEITKLENLTVLSLRNNKITELPHSFGRLRNLVELNIAGNRIRWLPWELFNLLEPSTRRLQNLHIYPNPLLRPFPSKDVSAQITPNEKVWWERARDEWIERVRLSSDPQALTYLGHTPESLFNPDGSMLPNSPPAVSNLPQSTSIYPPIHSPGQNKPFFENPESESGVQSLYELCLRNAASNLDFSALDPDLSSYGSELPPTVLSSLELARKASEIGPATCSVCGEHCIQHRAEWIEYWSSPIAYSEPDLACCLPFLRRSCSIKCAKTAGHVVQS